MKLKITVHGNDIDGLMVVLQEIKDRVAIGSTVATGANPTEQSSYKFNITQDNE